MSISLPFRKQRLSISMELILIILFALLVALGLHGFSFPVWYHYLGIKDSSAILLGHAQDIRSDDWNTFIPLALSQTAHTPSFPLINQNIGLGLNMLVPYALPVLHPLTFFRPSAWGFFLGNDAGLAWLWWFQALGLFYVYFLVFKIVSKENFWLSFCGSFIILFSAFVQNWALNCAPFAIFGGLIFVFSERLLFAAFNRISFLYLAGLIWSAVSFATFVYPPYQIAVAYYLLFLLLGLVWDRYEEILSDPHKWGRLKLFALAGLGSLIGAIYFFHSIREVQTIFENTAYPGKRISTGRDYDLGWLFGGNFFSTNLIRDWAQYSNICELSSFYFVFPILCPLLLGKAALEKRFQDKFSLLMLAHIAFSLCYMFFGFSESFSRLSLMSLVPAHRNLIALGLSNTTFLVAFLSRHQKIDLKQFLILGLPGIAAWLWLLWQGGLELSARFKELTSGIEILILALSFAWALLLFHKRAQLTALVILGAVLFYANSDFNPLVLGGTKQLFENKLSKRMLNIKEKDPNARWVTYSNGVISNLPRMLGISSISGLYTYPDLPLWKNFDPEGKFKEVYNRYAHVVFEFNKGSAAVFSTPQPDTVIVSVNPADQVFQKLDVRYFLVVGGSSVYFDSSPKFKRIFNYQDKFIYKRIA